MTKTNLVRTVAAGAMTIAVYDSRKSLGIAAAIDGAAKLREFLSKKDEVNIVFACAVSQTEFFDALFIEPDIDWKRVNGFIMDEYMGIEDPSSPALLANFAKKNIFDRADFKSCFTMNGSNPDFDAECERYADLLREHPLDISFLGVGENGHIAYNEPGIADFNDAKLVKIIELDAQSRIQAINDGTFSNINDVPKNAMTITIPPMINAEFVQVVVPGPNKSNAIKKTVSSEISTDFPSTVLRNIDCILYTETDGAALI